MFSDEFMAVLVVFGAMNLLAGLGMLLVIDAKLPPPRSWLASPAGRALRLAIGAGRNLAAFAAAKRLPRRRR